ncbi:MAG: DUF302 domain-containing protein [Bacteroidetes bacterium]|nr:MAG: DUF302 domain-containing protein [Bacteroidota bacterium]
MKKSNYGFSKTVDLSFEQAIQKVTEELQKEGFGILSDIDVQATLKKKLDVDFRPYRILGACNPPNAFKALQAEEQIGLLLPCNVIVYVNEQGQTVVAVIDPVAAMQVVGNPELNKVAEEILKKLQTALSRV